MWPICDSPISVQKLRQFVFIIDFMKPSQAPELE
jgi:hypothetical protein